MISRFMLVACIGLTPCLPLQAATPGISGSTCGGQVQVNVDDERLSTVLRQLADHAGFRLKLDPEADRDVSLHKQGTMQEVLRSLLGNTSLVMLEDTVARCGADYVVTEVWILPHGENINYVDYVPQAIEATETGPADVARPVGGAPPRGLRKHVENKDELRALRRRVRAGELVAHPDTGEMISREEYQRIMMLRGEPEKESSDD